MSTNHDRWFLVSILMFGAFMSGCTTPGAQQAEAAAEASSNLPAPFTFEKYEFVISRAKHETILTGFLLGGAVAELAAVRIDENKDRRLRLLAFADGAWTPKLDATLRPKTLFVDVATIGEVDRLIAYEPGRLNWFDPDSGREFVLVEVATDYRATEDDGIPHVDITRDLNHDGRDDLVLPDVDGFWISTQSGDGSFTEPVKLGPPEPFLDETAFDDKRNAGEAGLNTQTIPWILSRVHEMDYNQDGRSDLVFWNKDHFDAHLQDERGIFGQVPETFPAGVSFDSDGMYSHAFGYEEESKLALLFGWRAKTKRTVLRSLRQGERI